MSNTLPSFDKVQEHKIGKDKYTLPVTPDSEYCVDDSCFVPMAEAVKQLGLNPNFTGSDQKTAYDFPDGKDSGIEIPINRTKNGKDIAELSTEIANQQDKISSELQKEKAFQDYQAEIDKKMASSKAENVQNSVQD